jgi:hypothetical protein
MKQPGIALALAAALLATPVVGKTLRWASQGDPQTADPTRKTKASPTCSRSRCTTRW